jgi:hypothetical protein
LVAAVSGPCFDATRIIVVTGAPDRRRDLTGEIEDRFGLPVMTVAAPAA